MPGHKLILMATPEEEARFVENSRVREEVGDGDFRHHDLPAELYPMRISFLHWRTRAELHAVMVDLPPPGHGALVPIPGRDHFGVPVIVRAEFADGSSQEIAPEFHS